MITCPGRGRVLARAVLGTIVAGAQDGVTGSIIVADGDAGIC